MNEKLFELCKVLDISYSKISFFPNYCLIYTYDNIYYFIEKDEDILSFLRKIDFIYVLSPIHSISFYGLFPYYSDLYSSLEKGKKMMEAISFLHQKTLQRVELTENEKKEIYQDISSRIEKEINYYLDFQDRMEEIDSFPRLDYYYLLNNVSLLYQILYFAKEKLEVWFRGDSIILKSFCINNVSFSNFRFGEKIFFIDCKGSTVQNIVYNIEDFYRENYLEGSMMEFFSIYEKNNLLSFFDWNLFFSLICIPRRIVFSNDVYQNTVCIQKTLKYIDNTFQFVLEKDKEYQKTNE